MRAETGATWPQAQEGRAAPKSWNESTPEQLESTTLANLDFELLASETRREHISVVSSQPVGSG